MILRGRDAFGGVLRQGRLIHGHWIRCYVSLVPQDEPSEEKKIALASPPVRFGFAVPKKVASSAVLRNRIKRLMRETARLEKETLWNGLAEQKKTAIVIMMLRRHDPAVLKKLSFAELADEWRSMVPKILSLC